MNNWNFEPPCSDGECIGEGGWGMTIFVGNNILVLSLFLCLILPACTEFLSQDVADLALTLNSPADSLFTQGDEFTFWWEDEEEVENYHLQLVNPTFDNPFVLLDTVFTDNILIVSGLYLKGCLPGAYEQKMLRLIRPGSNVYLS